MVKIKVSDFTCFVLSQLKNSITLKEINKKVSSLFELKNEKYKVRLEKIIFEQIGEVFTITVLEMHLINSA